MTGGRAPSTALFFLALRVRRLPCWKPVLQDLFRGVATRQDFIAPALVELSAADQIVHRDFGKPFEHRVDKIGKLPTEARVFFKQQFRLASRSFDGFDPAISRLAGRRMLELQEMLDDGAKAAMQVRAK